VRGEVDHTAVELIDMARGFFRLVEVGLDPMTSASSSGATLSP